MGEYVSLEDVNIKDKKLYSLTIKKVEGIDCDYKLNFRKHKVYEQFYKLIQNVITVEATCTYVQKGEGGVFTMHLSSDEPRSKYVMVIESNEWFERNKKEIVEHLEKQAVQFKDDAQKLQDLREIEDALNEGSYAQIICDMIRKYAPKMTKDDLYKIQSAAVIESVNKRK